MKHLLVQLGFCCAAALAAAQADRDLAIAAKLRALESSRFEAQQHKDLAALDSILDDGLLLVDESGALWGKAQFLSRLRTSSAVLLRLEAQSVTVLGNGDTATVVGIYTEKELNPGRPRRQRCRFIDTWVWKGGRWLCIASTATPAIS